MIGDAIDMLLYECINIYIYIYMLMHKICKQRGVPTLKCTNANKSYPEASVHPDSISFGAPMLSGVLLCVYEK